jgi:hypothetical protein
MKKRIELRSLSVDSEDRLPELDRLLRYEHFILTDVDFDVKDGIARLPFWRVWHRGPSATVRNWLVYRVREVDVVRSMLWVNAVAAYEPVGDIEMHTYEFLRVEYDRERQRVVFLCNPGLRLEFVVDGIRIQASDLMVTGKAYVHSIPGFGEFYDGEIAE